MEQIILSAKTRHTKGKGAARRLRRNNQMPAIFYGPNADPVMLSVSDSELRRIMDKTIAESIILGLQIESENGKDTRTVVLKELQVDPVKDTYLHADFHEIKMDRELTINLQVRLVNTPVGVAHGGILQHIRRELIVSCLPDKLVESIELDVSGLDIGDSIHIGDIDLPEGIRTSQEDHLTIAVVAAPSVSAEPDEEEEVLEGEEQAEAEEPKAETDTETDSV